MAVCSQCGHANRPGVLFCTMCGVRLLAEVSQPHFLVLYGPDRGNMLMIQKPAMSIGRSEDNDLVLHDPAVSSHHAMLYYDGVTMLIQDQGSRNGTWVNGELIQEACELRDEYLVKLGDTLLRVRIPPQTTQIYSGIPTTTRVETLP